MAGKSPTELYELIRDLEAEIGTVTERLNLLRTSLDEANLIAIRERLAVVESICAELRRRAEEQDRRGERLTQLEGQLAEFKKQFEESDRRRWQVWLALGVCILTFVANLTLNLILFFARKPA
jgi:DNA repair exonuclease SbcCD ATPase subunit